MREAGRLALLASDQFTDLAVKSIADYVVGQQSENGKYTFCQETESNVQDTRYGLENVLSFSNFMLSCLVSNLFPIEEGEWPPKDYSAREEICKRYDKKVGKASIPLGNI